MVGQAIDYLLHDWVTDKLARHLQSHHPGFDQWIFVFTSKFWLPSRSFTLCHLAQLRFALPFTERLWPTLFLVKYTTQTLSFEIEFSLSQSLFPDAWRQCGRVHRVGWRERHVAAVFSFECMDFRRIIFNKFAQLSDVRCHHWTAQTLKRWWRQFDCIHNFLLEFI